MPTLFFPLRTSVELFEDRTSPAAIPRAKEGAVLFERLIFEAGLYDVTIGDDGAMHKWLPPDHITAEHLEHSRRVIRPGEPFEVSAHMEDGPGGELVGERHVLFSTPVGVQYMSEFESGILRDLAEFAPDWVDAVMFPTSIPTNTAAGDAIRQLDFRVGSDRDLMPDVPSFKRDFIIKSFNRDAVLAADLGAVFNMTSLFEPMIERGAVEPYAAGDEALDYLLPNVGALPWEAVLEFRGHPGCEDARGKLREFEVRALATEPEGVAEFSKQVGREVVSGLWAACDDLAPDLPQELQGQVRKVLFGMLPVVGKFSPVLDSIEAAGEAAEFRRTWIAAVMRLRSNA